MTLSTSSVEQGLNSSILFSERHRAACRLIDSGVVVDFISSSVVWIVTILLAKNPLKPSERTALLCSRGSSVGLPRPNNKLTILNKLFWSPSQFSIFVQKILLFRFSY